METLLSWKDNFVIIASLKASDGSDGQHDIAILNNRIYDANYDYVLTKTQQSLNWCCGGDGITCIGVHRSYIILPNGDQKRHPNDRALFQGPNNRGIFVTGWVCKHWYTDTPTIQFADGDKRQSTDGEFDSFISLM